MKIGDYDFNCYENIEEVEETKLIKLTKKEFITKAMKDKGSRTRKEE